MSDLDFSKLNPTLILVADHEIVGKAKMNIFNAEGQSSPYVEPNTKTVLEQMTAVLKVLEGTEVRHLLVTLNNLVAMIEHSVVQGGNAVVDLVKAHPELTEDQKDRLLQNINDYFQEEDKEEDLLAKFFSKSTPNTSLH